MSGHSKWSTIKRKKEATDKARGKEFSKLIRAIHIAIKTGGGPNAETNYKLKMAIEQAKDANMPKSNIERALSKASEAGDLEELVYEGFGPDNIGVLVEAATDNRNRTGQEIKGIFERAGGTLAGPGAVSYNFKTKGLILVEKVKDTESQILAIMDIEVVEDVEDAGDYVEVYVAPGSLKEAAEKITSLGFEIKSSELYKKPITTQKIADEKVAEKILALLDNLEVSDDVQKVFSNIDIEEDVLVKLS